MMVPVDVKRRAAEEWYWHYQHDLGDGVLTKPWWDQAAYWHPLRKRILFERLEEHVGPSLTGLRCLEMACNSGYWSFELAERGAEAVFAFDRSPDMIRGAEFVRECRNDRPEYGRIEFRVDDCYTVDLPESVYDVVLCMGIMYHLTDVLGVAKRMCRATRGLAFVDSSVSDLPGNVLEIPEEGKYFWCEKNEFSFVPTRGALRQILEKAGFSKVTPWIPEEGHPAYGEYGPNGFRHIIICEK